MKTPSVVKNILNSIFSNVGGSNSWWPFVREPYSGAWQRNEELSQECLLAYNAVFSCITLIASDIAKLRFVLKKYDPANSIWVETSSSAFSPFLSKPNSYQNHIQFKEWWMLSKLSQGNVYGLKQRDNRNVVVAVYVLDACRVTPLISSNGDVYYQLQQSDLNKIEQDVIVPASEIIHDRMNCLFHPLVGISPLWACALTSAQGIAIQKDSNTFFKNGARPSGILTAPGAISDDTAKRLKEHWDQNYTGQNAGRVAVLGDNLKFEQMKATAVDSQLIEQLQLSFKIVCSTFHVPPFKVGLETIPPGAKLEELNQIYYTDCLQKLIEDMEVCLDEGLNLTGDLAVELDIDRLLRMDSETLYNVLGEGIKQVLLKPNEARRRLNLPKVEGGDTLYIQQQNYSLSALAKRDAKDDPFSKEAQKTETVVVDEPEEITEEEQAKLLSLFLEKELSIYEH